MIKVAIICMLVRRITQSATQQRAMNRIMSTKRRRLVVVVASSVLSESQRTYAALVSFNSAAWQMQLAEEGRD